MAYMDNVTTQIFPQEWLTSNGRQLHFNNVGITYLAMTREIMVNGFTLTPTSVSASVVAGELQIVFNSSVDVSMGMVVVISNSSNPNINGRWRVKTISVDKKTLTFFTKASIPLNNTSNLSIGTVNISIASLGWKRYTDYNEFNTLFPNALVQSAFNNYNSSNVHQTLYGTYGDGIYIETSPVQLRMSTGIANVSTFSSFNKKWLAHPVLTETKDISIVGTPHSINFYSNWKSSSFNNTTSSCIFQWDDFKNGGVMVNNEFSPLFNHHKYSYSSNEHLRYSAINKFRYDESNYWSSFNSDAHINNATTRIYKASPTVYRPILTSDTTVVERPLWAIYTQPNEYIYVPGSIGLIQYESNLRQTGLHYSYLRNNNNEMILYSFTTPDAYEYPHLIPLNDQFYLNPRISNQHWF